MHFDPQCVIEIDPNLRDNGEPILHIAIRNGRYYIVKKLLERGADLYCRNSDGLTALQVAQGTENKEMIRFLSLYLERSKN